MLDKLTEYFPELGRVSDPSAIKKFFIANRDGELSLTIRVLDAVPVLKDFDIQITAQLGRYINDATNGWFINITSLQSNKVRLYSAHGWIEYGDDFKYPVYEEYGEPYGVGLYYDPEQDVVTCRKLYYVNEDATSFTHFKYAGGEETGPYIEVEDYESTDYFIDDLNIIPELEALGVKMFSAKRLDDDVSQTYLHIKA